MSQLDFLSALTRLLSDSRLRARFRADAATVAKEFTSDEAVINSLCVVDPEQLDRQAETLLCKRQAHVAEILPRTCKLSRATFVALFREFAEQAAWPTGHQRHFHDAARFCEFLKSRTTDLPVAAEYHWAAFVADGHWLRVRFDGLLAIDAGTTLGLQIFYRNREGTPLHWSIHI